MNHLYLQCLECGLYKMEAGAWGPRTVDPLVDKISHTYCPVCIESLQEQLIVSREFADWEFQPQIQYLKKVLQASPKKFDVFRLKYLLTQYYHISETIVPRYIMSLGEYLCESVCTYCLEEITLTEHILLMGPCKLHLRCFNELSDKMDLLQRNKWSESKQLDAYLDYLEIQKELRPSLKKQLQDEAGDPEMV